MENTTKILFINDPAESENIILDKFTDWGIAIYLKQVSSLEGLSNSLKNDCWDIVISEYEFPGFTAFDVLETVKQASLSIPIIIVSDDLPEESVLELVKAGISGYVPKIELSRLRQVIYRILHGKVSCGSKRDAANSGEQIEKSREFYQRVFDEFPGFIWWVDAEGNHPYVNKSWLEFSGQNPSEDVLDVWRDRIHPEDIIRSSASYHKAISNKSEFQVESRIMRHDGVYRWICDIGKPIFNFQGQFIGYLGSAYDITERKNAEDRLAASEQSYRLLFTNMPEAFLYGKVICDSQGMPVDYIILEINSAFEEMIGFKRAEILERKATEINPKVKESEPNLVETCGMVALTGEKRRFELKMDYKGKVYSVLTYSPCHGYFVNIFTDITEQKRAEAEILKLSSALEQSSAMAIITDTEGVIEYVNSQFTSITGYTLEEAYGRDVKLIESGKMPDRLMHKMWEKIKNGEVWEGEFINKKKNGEFYWASATISPIRDHNGNITHYVSIQDDITDKKRMQQELEKNNKKLQKAVKELKLMQEQLIHQEKLAGIGHLAAGVAHEINNPLGFVVSNFDTLGKYFKGFNELIQAYRSFTSQVKGAEYSLTAQHMQLLEELSKRNNIDFMLNDINDIFNDCNDGLKRIKNIVSGLSTFVRSEKQDIFMEYDINSGIESTLAITHNEIKYHAEVKKELGKVPLIRAVGDQINQVLLNLIVNAIHAISSKDSKGKGQITVKTYCDNKYLYCEIEDNGTGIPKENMKKIFNPFFTTKPVGQGTGLGLSISYNIIVSRHNGQLTVKSEYGKGTSFMIKLPIRNIQD